MAELVIKTVRGKLFGPLKMRETLPGGAAQKVFLRSEEGNFSRDILQIFSKNIASYGVMDFREKICSIFSAEEIKYCVNHPRSTMVYDVEGLWSDYILSGIEVELLVVNNKIIAFGNKGKWLSAKSCSKISDLEKFKRKYIAKHLKEVLIDFKLSYEALIPYIGHIWDDDIQKKLNEIKAVFDKGGVDELIERLK